MTEHELKDPAQMEPQFPGGEYALDGILGSGGMAVVYRARDLRRPRDVAIKVLRPDVAKLIGTERFLREIAVTAGFTHPHILPLLDSGETVDAMGRSCPYYVMPLIEGDSLEDRLERDERMAWQDAVRLTCEILSAIRYAHEHNVIHRDIKPANILLSGGHAVVADFGVARPMAGGARVPDGGKSLTEFGFVVGTPEYMSPEQALGDERVDERCDLYAAACVLYEMVVGQPPFDGPTAQTIVSRKLSGEFPPASSVEAEVPVALDRILSVALSPDPAHRFDSAATFLLALTQLDVRSSAPGPAMSGRARRTRPLLLALAVVVVAVAGVAMWRVRSEPPALPPPSGVSDKSRVAVLPFEVIAPDRNASLEAVAMALNSDLIDELSGFPALTVISRNGVLPFQGTAARADSVARMLHVGSIVTGDMRGFGDSVTVRVRLVDGATSQQLAIVESRGAWLDVLSVRSSIIDSVTSFLRKEIGEEIRARSERRASNPDAWELLARARFMADGDLGRSGTLPAAERAARFGVADSLLRRAMVLDEDWVAPEAFRINLMLLRATVEEGARTVTSADARLRAASALRREAVRLADDVLSREPGHAGALLGRGRARAALWRTDTKDAPDSLRVAAAADLREAVSRRKDMADAWNELSLLHYMHGDYDDARNAAESALKADAFMKSAEAVVSRLFSASLASGRIDDARMWCENGKRQFPQDPRFWGCDLTRLGWSGRTPADVADAWEALAQSEARDSSHVLAAGWATRRLLVAAVAARAGLADSAEHIVRLVRAAPSAPGAGDQTDYGEAHVLSLLGRTDAAVRLLERYLRANPAWRGQVRQSPWFAALHDHPRFREITAPR